MEIEGDKFLRLTAKLAGFEPAIACTRGCEADGATLGDGTGDSLGGEAEDVRGSSCVGEVEACAGGACDAGDSVEG
jgi:hypothetical protein